MVEATLSFISQEPRSKRMSHAVSENPIEVLASEMQALASDVRWLHARPDTILARACGLPILRGPRTRLVNALISVGPHWLSRLLACAASFTFLVSLGRRSLPTAGTATLEKNLFIGIGALRERTLIADLTAARGSAPTFLNETSTEDFEKVLRISFSRLFGEWRQVVSEAWAELGASRERGLPPAERRVGFATQGHLYAYYRAWFKEVKRLRHPAEPIVFAAASVTSYAAVAAGLRCAYHLHGFLRQSLVFPDFEEVRCFTAIERDHMARRLPRADVSVSEEPSDCLSTERVVAVAGCYDQTTGMEECAEFVAWAQRSGIPVILRPHPRDRSGYFDRWRGADGVTFSDTAMPFDVFLEHHRPRLLLSWYSTTLFDALRRGVIPVTVPLDPWRPMDMVYPFAGVSLHWPEEREEVARIVEDAAERDELLARKRRVGGILPVLS